MQAVELEVFCEWVKLALGGAPEERFDRDIEALLRVAREVYHPIAPQLSSMVSACSISSGLLGGAALMAAPPCRCLRPCRSPLLPSAVPTGNRVTVKGRGLCLAFRSLVLWLGAEPFTQVADAAHAAL